MERSIDELFGITVSNEKWLASLQRSLDRPAPRRELADDEVRSLITAWREGTGNGRRLGELGPLHGYLGWSEAELAEWLATRVPT